MAVAAIAYVVLTRGEGPGRASRSPETPGGSSPTQGSSTPVVGSSAFLDAVPPSKTHGLSEYSHGPQEVDGIVFPESVALTSEGEEVVFATYRLPAAFSRLSGFVGLTDDTKAQDIDFSVMQGESVALASVSVRHGPPQPFSVPLGPGRTLTLRAKARDCSAFPCTVGAVWVDPVLHGSGADPVVQGPSLAPATPLGGLGGESRDGDAPPEFGPVRIDSRVLPNSIAFEMSTFADGDWSGWAGYDLGGRYRTLKATLAIRELPGSSSSFRTVTFHVDVDFSPAMPDIELTPGRTRTITVRLRQEGDPIHHPGGRLEISVSVGGLDCPTMPCDVQAVWGTAILHGTS